MITRKVNIKSHFDKHSERYAENFHHCRSGKSFEFAQRCKIVGEFSSGLNGEFLDVACGTGEVTQYALSSGNYNKARIVDLSEAMLKIAKDKLSFNDIEIEFECRDVFNLSGQFDVINCIGLIAHTGELDRLMKLFAGLLRPNGVLLIQSTIGEHLGSRIEKKLSGKRFALKHGYQISYYSTKLLVESFLNNDFLISDAKRYCLGVPYGDKISKNLNYILENVFQGLSRKHGSEIIYKLIRQPV